MSDPVVVESYPCPSCDQVITLRDVVDGAWQWACPNNHWWQLDFARGWVPIDQPEAA